MSRYAEAHKPENLRGPGDARPTAMQIVADEGLQGSMIDKVFFLTGCSSGIGIDTAEALAATGATCFLGARNIDKAREACSKILENGRVELIQIDVSSLVSVRKAAENFRSRSSQLNVLINNAGIMACPEEETTDGIEKQFATNYLGAFLLFEELKSTLLQSSTPTFHSRVINVSSSGHHASAVHFDNINLVGEYQPYLGYGQSKTAAIWMTNEIERKYGRRGLHGLSLMPGGVRTNLQRYTSSEGIKKWEKGFGPNRMKSTSQGAATSVYAAVGKEWEGVGGLYLEDCAEAVATPKGAESLYGFVPHAYSPENETKLWDVADKICKGLK